MDKLRLYLSEFIGTFVLVFIGVGSVGGTHLGHNHPLELLPIALAFGLVVAVMVAAIGHLSGCHINPAVTVALLVTGKIKIIDALAYVVAQLAGATLGAAALSALFNVDPGLHAINAAAIGTTNLNTDLGVTVGQGLGIEFVLTFILVFTIFGTAVNMRSQKLPSLFIGLIVVVNILVGGIYTGASMNPARTFGPAVVAHVWANHWIYWAGPIAGGIAAAWVYSLLFLPRTAAQAAPEVRPDAAR